MDDQLKFVLSLINEWLKFAEAKNGVVVAASTAVALGVVQAGTLWDPAQPWRTAYVLMVVACLALGGVAALLSFLPKTHIPFLTMKEPPNASDNLIFFGDIAKYSPEALLGALATRTTYALSNNVSEQWLAEQVVINARIAAWKYGCFKVALFFIISAIMTPAIAAVLFIATTEGKRAD